jgi:hypothetical protein
MYYLASIGQNGEATRYNGPFQPYKLFGCNAGMVCRRLKHMTKIPRSWHLSVRDEVQDDEKGKACAVIVDIKPGDTKQLFLCELTDIWGDSSASYTPILLRLQGLRMDSSIEDWRNGFDAPPIANSVIYSFLYLSGGIVDGKLKGEWTPPRPSSTNGPLLWPSTIRYFHEVMQTKDPTLFSCSVQVS